LLDYAILKALCIQPNTASYRALHRGLSLRLYPA